MSKEASDVLKIRGGGKTAQELDLISLSISVPQFPLQNFDSNADFLVKAGEWVNSLLIYKELIDWKGEELYDPWKAVNQNILEFSFVPRSSSMSAPCVCGMSCSQLPVGTWMNYNGKEGKKRYNNYPKKKNYCQSWLLWQQHLF